MKNRLLLPFIPLLLLAVITCTGCVTVSFRSNDADGILGTGASEWIEYETEAFRGVVIDYTLLDEQGFAEAGIEAGRPEEMIEVVYTPKDTCELQINMQENFTDYLNVSVENGILIISADPKSRLMVQDKSLAHKISISAPELDFVSIEGCATLSSAGPIVTDTFTLMVDGIGKVLLPLKVRELRAGLDGMGEVELTGTAEQMIITLSGMVNTNAAGLEAKQGEVRMDGSANLWVNCSDVLDISGSGVGAITYTGTPEINHNQNMDGMISLIQAAAADEEQE